MQRCQYCGKQYPDDTTVCPIDQQPLWDPAAAQKTVATTFAGTFTAFNAKLVSPMSLAGAYRIYVQRNDLLFIQTEGGANSLFGAIAPLLGPVGTLAGLASSLFSKRKTRYKLENIDQENPEELLRETENNFKLNASEIRDAAIEPPALFVTAGKAGRLNLTVRHGEKIKLEFDNDGEMNTATRLLAQLLNSTLRVNVEWNEKKQRFQKKETSASKNI